MSVSNEKAKNRIINALGDLYRIERHSTSMLPEQRQAVNNAIATLEAEYMEILTASGPATYSKFTASFKSSKSDLDEIVAERNSLANSFVSAAKILGSLAQVLKLF